MECGLRKWREGKKMQRRTDKGTEKKREKEKKYTGKQLNREKEKPLRRFPVQVEYSALAGALQSA